MDSVKNYRKDKNPTKAQNYQKIMCKRNNKSSEKAEQGELFK